MIAGEAAVTVWIDKTGAVTKIEAASKAHPLLLEEAKSCVGEWRFQAAESERALQVVSAFGFSAQTREMNPVTKVDADFLESSIRVSVTTDRPVNSFPVSK